MGRLIPYLRELEDPVSAYFQVELGQCPKKVKPSAFHESAPPSQLEGRVGGSAPAKHRPGSAPGIRANIARTANQLTYLEREVTGRYDPSTPARFFPSLGIEPLPNTAAIAKSQTAAEQLGSPKIALQIFDLDFSSRAHMVSVRANALLAFCAGEGRAQPCPVLANLPAHSGTSTLRRR